LHLAALDTVDVRKEATVSTQQESEIAGEPTKEIDLTGQVALVTGAGRGIGRATALALGDAGAAVAICARSEGEISAVEAELAAGGAQALALRVDVADRGAVEHMVAQVERELGPVDLLVNNAVAPGPIGPFVSTDPDDWWRPMEVNLRGPVYCSRAVLPRMVERGHGRIVNVSSGVGLVVWPMVSSYVVAKAALYRLTEALDAETREHGVRLFVMNPGLVRTRLVEDAMSAGEPSVEKTFLDMFDAGLESPPERAAAMVVHLASGRADVLSGRCLDVSDDLPDMVARAAEIEELDLYAMRLRVPGEETQVPPGDFVPTE
jgi:NAD(P)-dependent dehydrogenase (short-subunit alcohol dehydrogenase family)